MTKHMGQAIRSMADELGLKAEDIAPVLGRTVGTVYNIYTRQSVDTDTLFLLSNLFKKPVAAFFGDTYNEIATVMEEKQPYGNGADSGVVKDYEHKIELLELQLKHKEELLSIYQNTGRN